MWYEITQIKRKIEDHRDSIWQHGYEPAQTESDVYHYHDMKRERAFRVGKIIKPLKQSFTLQCQELESLLSQYPQSDQRLEAFQIDVEDVRKAFLHLRL